MKDMIKMVVVLTALCLVSGGSLAFIRDKTKDQIEYQQLTFVKGPAIRSILDQATNNPIEDRFKIQTDNGETSFFVGVVEDQPKHVAFESSGKGYSGDVGLIVGVDVETDKIIGVSVTTHSETPGVGSRAKSEPGLTAQFSNLPLEGQFKVKNDGGQIDAISGATITSRAVATGVTEAGKAYKQLKPQILEKVKDFK
jgi:Na+-translocating ferredoxin:NAD+ oxidoreductase subunit G